MCVPSGAHFRLNRPQDLQASMVKASHASIVTAGSAAAAAAAFLEGFSALALALVTPPALVALRLGAIAGGRGGVGERRCCGGRWVSMWLAPPEPLHAC